LADIPVADASAVLVLLTRANILRIQPSAKEDVFVFRYHEEGAEEPPVERAFPRNGRDKYT
jgi:hypothetical protein